MRSKDERDRNGRGTQNVDEGLELLVPTSLFWIFARQLRFAAKAPWQGVVVKVKTAIEFLPVDRQECYQLLTDG
jgi:hypothetical protein